MRTVNVPVRHGRSNFSGQIHSRPEFFSVGKNFAHGDDPYNGWVRLGHNVVPIARVFWSDADLHAQIDAPAPLPGKTVLETASHNKDKQLVGLAVEFKTNYLLHQRCIDTVSGIIGPSSKMHQQLTEFYSDAQIAAIETACDAALAAIPGGCNAVVNA
jgi:hypothetical protein